MKKIIFFLSALLALPSIASHKTNNGGGAMVCRHKYKEVDVELLEFWEAKNLKKMKLLEGKTSSQYIELIKSRLIKDFPNPAWESIFNVAVTLFDLAENPSKKHSKFKVFFLDNGIRIAPPQDALTSFLPKDENCSVEGLGLFDDNSEQLTLDAELYRQVDALSKAGLFVHEALYRYLRTNYGVVDSVSARQLTGCFFSSEPCVELSNKFLIESNHEKALNCQVPGWFADFGPEVFLPKPRRSKIGSAAPKFYLYPISDPDSQGIRLWRFVIEGWQSLENKSLLPLAATYFDVGLKDLSVGEQGELYAKIYEIPRDEGTWVFHVGIEAFTKSSEVTFDNIGPSLTYQLESETIQNNVLTISGKGINCKAAH